MGVRCGVVDVEMNGGGEVWGGRWCRDELQAGLRKSTLSHFDWIKIELVAVSRVTGSTKCLI